jgi:hypothetical protein
LLERAEVGTGQDMEREKASKGHSQPRQGRGQDWSEFGIKMGQQGALTSWREQRLGIVRKTWNKVKQQGYLQPGEVRGQDWSSHRK